MTKEQDLLLECYIRCGFDKDKAIGAYNLLQTLNTEYATTVTTTTMSLEDANTSDTVDEYRNDVEEVKEENTPYDMIGELRDGFRLVEQNDRFNYIDENKNLVFDIWFDRVSDIEDGLTIVTVKNHGFNILNRERKLLLPEMWFDSHAREFSEGYMAFKVKNKCNFFDREGKILFPNQWYDVTCNFLGGKAFVGLNGEYFYIDKKGKRAVDDYINIIKI